MQCCIHNYLRIFILALIVTQFLYAGAENPDILQAQQKLGQLGYYQGPQDGILGDLTIEALKAFQKDNNLPVTGAWDDATANRLELKKRLRNTPELVSQAQIPDMIKTCGLHHPTDYSGNDLCPVIRGDMQHLYSAQTQKNVDVVVDQATDLMWQQSGSKDMLMWEGVAGYVQTVNAQQFAGFSDWRLPTIEELASLMEGQINSDNMYIDACFDGNKTWFWSADKVKEDPDQSVWIVNFEEGHIDLNNIYLDSYVRLVREGH